MAQKSSLLALTLLLAVAAQAKTYNFQELSVKDYTEMNQLIRGALGKNTIDDVEREPKVRAGLKIVLSRRNTDGKRSALFTSLQGQLPEPFFMLSIQKIAEEAVATMKSKSASNMDKTTAYVVLENLLSELSPRVSDYKSTFEMIAKADLVIDEELGTFCRLAGMSNNASPSAIAEAVIEKLDKEDSKNKIAKNPDLED
jgi:hypothetical protein